jgi:trans-2-enoyl-CoA reductase
MAITGNLAGYQSGLLLLFSLGLDGVDYDADTDTGMKVLSIGLSGIM